jgi:ABC-type polysaccharide/polyol phosphate transport system ATPase subunit
MSTTAISVDGVSKNFRLHQEKNQYLKSAILRGKRARYEEFWALRNVTFDIQEGSTFGIIGSNGSGKSTMLKCLSGILFPDEGQITVNGRIAALLELGAGFHYDLTGRENIFLNGAVLGMTNKEIRAKFDSIVDFSGLGEFIDVPVKNYSTGMVVRLGFAIAINVDPDILIIDEILAVGDATFQQKSLEKIEDFRKAGKTIVLVSHGLSDVSRLCDRIAWLNKGSLQMLGDPYEVVPEYMGMSHNAKEKEVGEIGERWGSGEIQISKVELLDSDSSPTQLFETNQKMGIRIHLESKVEATQIVVGARFSNLHGQPVWGTNTKLKGLTYSASTGESKLDLFIDELLLLEGTYEISLTISDSSGAHEFDHWENRLRFTVNQNTNLDVGLITMKSRWIL